MNDRPAFEPIRVPAWSWVNLLSLDAVAIGSFWQAVFTFEFCGRAPAAYEAAVIALSIWMVYTADRLFDSLRLDLGRPHTLRHRMHYEYRNALITVWVGCLVIDVILIASCASESQLRWGYVAVAAVLAYSAGVHLVGAVRSWIPKELQAGVVFAFGVGLPAWAETSLRVDLIASTLMAGVLFTVNCLLIACWDRDLDLSQRFDSWATRSPSVTRWLPVALIMQMAVVVVLSCIHLLPTRLAGCLVVSDGLLLMLALRGRGYRPVNRVPSEKTAPVCRLGLCADAALVAPPAVWAVLTVMIR